MINKLHKLFINSNEHINDTNLFFELSKIDNFDFSTNIAMRIAKSIKRDPVEFALEIVNSLKNNKLFEKIEVAKPGFINIRLNDESICEDLDKIFNIKKPKSKIIVVDYSSPNIAKKMHIGHLRSTVIGDAIVKLLRHYGHKVIGDSHLGDWGTQFGKLIIAYNMWLDQDAYKKDPIAELQRIYIKFHDKENDDLLNQARQVLVKLQKKEEPYISLWKEFVDKSLKEYATIYKELKISFDYQLGESFYNEMMQPIVNDLMDKGVAVSDQGAKVVFFDEKTKIPPAIIQKGDDGFLYTTSDVATVNYRRKELKAQKAIYVTDIRQANHFRQVFAITNKAKIKLELVHVPFGLMSLKTGNISTRGGNIIDLKTLLDQGYKKALDVVDKKSPNLSKEKKEQIAKVVSVGAVKYFDLSHQRTTDITFTWNKALAFSGNSSPYIQYTYTRICSLIKKANIKINKQGIRVTNDKERTIVRLLYQYNKTLDIALEKLELHTIANYLFKLTSAFNSWYADVKIINDKENLNSRLYIAKQVKEIIKEGLSILGIEVLEKM